MDDIHEGVVLLQLLSSLGTPEAADDVIVDITPSHTMDTCAHTARCTAALYSDIHYRAVAVAESARDPYIEMYHYLYTGSAHGDLTRSRGSHAFF